MRATCATEKLCDLSLHVTKMSGYVIRASRTELQHPPSGYIWLLARNRGWSLRCQGVLAVATGPVLI